MRDMDLWGWGTEPRLERYEAAFRDNEIDDILPSRCTAGSLILSAPDWTNLPFTIATWSDNGCMLKSPT
jgi:hypothetical protein